MKLASEIVKMFTYHKIPWFQFLSINQANYRQKICLQELAIITKNINTHPNSKKEECLQNFSGKWASHMAIKI